MPHRFLEFKNGARLLYDEEKMYERKLKQLARRADLLNQEYVKFALTGEEFIDGHWEVIYHYPKEFDPEKVL